MSALVYTPMADKDGPQSLTTHDRNLGNGHQTPSPLKLFVQAKKHINEVFRDIKSYIEESYSFLKDVSVDDNVVSKDDVELVKKHLDKVSGICEVLARNHMKVVFFGRTSNGKSTVVNAMLRNKILPTGIGHTTNCFLQVEGGNSSEAYLLTEDSPEPKSLQSVKELAHALSDVKLDKSSLIRIIWPKEKCSLLKDDVVLVDSPGIDVDPDLDSWIDKHCLDADVFVLVANAESTLMQTEKKFFHKVSERLSKPNIFILNNRWDASASEPEYMEEVKSQHLDRNLAFLSDELGVINRKEAADRVFFVSAKEALISRLNQEEGTPTPQGAMADGFQIRLFEFANFERQFEECISKTAVHTKFEKHAQRGKLITSDLRNVNDQVYSQALEYRNKSIVHRQEKSDKFDYTDKQLSLLTNEIKDKIKLMVENVEGKVSTALNEEIRRLSVLVDEFDRPFHPDIISMNIYKKELHAHVEHTLGRNLQTRCSAALLQAVQNSEKDMTERLLALLPEDQKQQVSNLMPLRDFEMSYRLDCRNLCADFREDIEFRFSLGLTSMMNRFLGPKGARTVLMGYSDAIPRPVPMTPQTPSNECHSIDRHDNEMMMALLTTFASLTSRSTVGAVVVSGLVAKAAGWRVIAVCGTIYGLLYVYERLTWTKKAKERVFKRQYVDHASSKLKLIIDLTSANCSHQVQQELASVFTRLSHQVDHAKSELMDEIKNLDIEIQDVEEIGNKSKILRNKAGWLDNELNNFIQQYLLRG